MTQNYHNNLNKNLMFFVIKKKRIYAQILNETSYFQVIVFNILYFGFRCIMKWSQFLDTLLACKILVIQALSIYTRLYKTRASMDRSS